MSIKDHILYYFTLSNYIKILSLFKFIQYDNNTRVCIIVSNPRSPVTRVIFLEVLE